MSIPYVSAHLHLGFSYPSRGCVEESDDVILVHADRNDRRMVVRLALLRQPDDPVSVIDKMAFAAAYGAEYPNRRPITRSFDGRVTEGVQVITERDSCEIHCLMHPEGFLTIKLYRLGATVVDRVELFRLFGKTFHYTRTGKRKRRPSRSTDEQPAASGEG